MRHVNNARRPYDPLQHGLFQPGTIIAFLVLAGLAGGVFACRTFNANSVRTEHFAAIDISVSNAEQKRLSSELSLFDYAVDNKLPYATKVTLWAFASKRTHVSKVYAGTPEESSDLWEVERKVHSMAVVTDHGTNPEVALNTLAEAARVSKAKRIIITLLWDGEMSAGSREVRAAAKALALNSRVVAVICIGVLPDKGMRTEVEKALSPLSDRLIVCGPYDRAEIERVGDLLASTRTD